MLELEKLKLLLKLLVGLLIAFNLGWLFIKGGK